MKPNSFVGGSSEMPPRRKDGSPPRSPRRKRLTEFDVCRTKPEATAFQIWDGDVKGLCVRIQPTGHRAYFVRYNRGGRRRWYHIGDVARFGLSMDAAKIGLSRARERAIEINLQVMRGEDPVADRQAQRGGKTFAEIYQIYINEDAMKNHKSWRKEKQLVEKHVLPRLGKLQFEVVTRADVRALIRTIKSPSVANRVLAHTSAAYTWAMGEDLVERNPCAGIKSHPMEPRSRQLSDTELRELLLALKREGTVQARALTAAALLGQRPGEVSHMRREHIVDGWWEMPGKPIPALDWKGTKNGDSNSIWLPRPVMELIGDGATGFAFSNENGGPVSRLDELMRKVCKEIGIEHATPRDLRRTHQSLLQQCGQTDRVIDLIANHRMNKIDRTYKRYKFRPEIQRAMEVTATFIMDLVEGRQAGNVVTMVR
jgi:integrase